MKIRIETLNRDCFKIEADRELFQFSRSIQEVAECVCAVSYKIYGVARVIPGRYDVMFEKGRLFNMGIVMTDTLAEVVNYFANEDMYEIAVSREAAEKIEVLEVSRQITCRLEAVGRTVKVFAVEEDEFSDCGK